MNEGRIIADDTLAAFKERLGSTVVELGMGNESQALHAAEVITRRLGQSPERKGAMLQLASRNGSALLLDILHSLDAGRLTPRTVAVRESSLDDVFLALTGHRTESGNGGTTAPFGGAP